MSIENVKIGLVCLGLEGEHNELAERFRASAVERLTGRNVTVINAEDGYTLTGSQVIEQTERCRQSGADAIVYLVGTWILANHVVDAVRELPLPIAIWGVPEPISFSSVGANVTHGILGEMGIDHRLIYGFPEDERTIDQLIAFLKAAAVKRELSHLRLGLIGGRAISAYPTSADPNQVKKVFGIEIEHIDQLVLLEKARAVPVEVVDVKIEEMRHRYASVDVPVDMLRRAVSVYFALKELASQEDLDMVTVKCIGEFMDNYSSCCVALSMLNDEGFVSGCQCNINAMISSYILSKLSGQPCFFGDVNCVDVDGSSMRLINCGGVPGRLAKDYKDIRIVPQYEYMGAGRGACTFFCMKPGKVTVGTLGRDRGEYVMNIATGTAYTQPEDELEKVRSWAQGFVKLDCDPMEFYNAIRCNHSVVAYGDHKDVLLELCRLYGIRPETTLK